MLQAAFNKAESIPMLKTLGISLTESSPLHAVMEVVVSAKHAGACGETHGGLLATLAEAACCFPHPLVPSGTKVAIITLNLNYMRPVCIGERFRARADLLRLGRRTANLGISILNDSGTPVAQGSAVLMILSDQDPASAS